MPRFTESEYVDVDIDINVDDFLEECTSREIDGVIDWLIDNNHINEPQKTVDTNLSFDEEHLHKNLDKIRDSYYLLSEEEEELIKQIANKL
jgi:hypothetical protein